MSSSNRLRFVVVSIFALALALAPGASAQGVSEEKFLLRVTILDPERGMATLTRMDLDIAGFSPKTGTVDVVGTRATLERLRERGFPVEIARDLTPTPDSVTALSDYMEPAEIDQAIDNDVAAYPSLAKKVQYATTAEGRPVYALKISGNVAAEEDEPAIFFVAQHHAREVMTPEIAMDIASYLLSRYGIDPQVTNWVDTREIWILPNHNPDGSYYVFHNDSNWRKNRRDNGNGTFGVDPNRNYSFKWGTCSGSSSDPGSETYRGPSPASEPETFQGITQLARDQRPVINLSYHTYGELVIMPYGCAGSYTPENEAFRRITSDMASRLVADDPQFHYQPGTAPELLYAVDGEMNDWFYGELGSYGVTIEANAGSQGFQPDYATWRDSTVARNRPGWQYLLDRLDGPSIRGHVTDACTGAPLAANLSLDEVAYSNGETARTSEPGFGRYQWLTIPGDYHLHVEATGYTPQVWPVTVGRSAVGREVRLAPAGSGGLAAYGVVVHDEAADDDGEADPGEQLGLNVRLVATGAALSGVTATLTTSDPLVTILDGTASYGSIAAGAVADGDGFTIAISPLAPDEHEAILHLAFSAGTSLCAPQDDVVLRVTTGRDSCPFASETLDANPGWTIQNAGTGGWQFGAPAGNGGSTGPSSAPTGTNVYGTNLSGNYGDNGDFVLITTPFDLTGLRHAELRYLRWLDDEPGYDMATVDVSTDGGAHWTQAWAGFGHGEGWQQERIDVSALADGQPDVRLRFRLKSDTNTNRPGFYVDDVSFCGESVPTAAGRLKYESSTIDDSNPQYANGNGAVDAGETVTLPVQIRSTRDTASTHVEAFLTTSTPGVTIRNGFAAFADVPAAGLGSSLAPHFTFTTDASSCAKMIAFTLDVRWDGGRSTSTFGVAVGTSRTTVVLNDTFETNQGWTTGGNATAGAFVREDPYGVTDALGQPVQPENDVSADPGALCWVTGNPRPKGNFNPLNGDVDGGTAWVQSPAFDGTNAQRLDLTFSRWFVRRAANGADTSEYRFLASNDGGATWTIVDRTSADSPAWALKTFDLVPILAPGANMRLRMEVQESLPIGGGDTLLEGLLDDVKVERRRLECDPYTTPVHTAPNAVGANLVLAKDGGSLRLDWSPSPVDASHDAATSYRVYRSSSPGAGYGVVATPTANADVRPDELLDGVSRCFLIVAENSGGTSGDVPAP